MKISLICKESSSYYKTKEQDFKINVKKILKKFDKQKLI